MELDSDADGYFISPQTISDIVKDSALVIDYMGMLGEIDCVNCEIMRNISIFGFVLKVTDKNASIKM